MKLKILTLFLISAMLITGGVYMLSNRQEVSLSERRQLAQWPGITWNTLLSGGFMDSAEKAAADQFPVRDAFRRVKALYLRYAMGQLDNNGIYVHQGSAAMLDYPLSTASVEHAIARFRWIQDQYLKDAQVYYAVVPDKNYYFAPQGGYPAMDYDQLFQLLSEGLDMTEIDLTSLLSGDSYYRTDPHWRQECLVPAAEKLAQGMGVAFSDHFTVKYAGLFSGAYAGQSALPLEADMLAYLQSEALAACTVYDPIAEQEVALYDASQVQGRDPYAFFLAGASPIQVITSPHASTSRELILFRDSYGSSLAPLLAESYAKITLIDIRYISSELLDDYVNFAGQDVLFLYSTLTLNSSQSLK